MSSECAAGFIDSNKFVLHCLTFQNDTSVCAITRFIPSKELSTFIHRNIKDFDNE